MLAIRSGLGRLLGHLRPDSLRTQLTLALAVAAAVPLAVAALLSTFSAITEAVDAALGEQATLASAMAAYLDGYIDMHEEAIAGVARQPNLLSADPAAQEALLHTVRSTLPDL